MAFYVEVIKMKEDKYFIHYKYQFKLPGDQYKSSTGKIRFKSKLVSGILKLDKLKGDVYVIEFAEGDQGNHAKRASWALMKHWLTGEFPEKTTWAS